MTEITCPLEECRTQLRPLAHTRPLRSRFGYVRPRRCGDGVVSLVCTSLRICIYVFALYSYSRSRSQVVLHLQCVYFEIKNVCSKTDSVFVSICCPIPTELTARNLFHRFFLTMGALPLDATPPLDAPPFAGAFSLSQEKSFGASGFLACCRLFSSLRCSGSET